MKRRMKYKHYKIARFLFWLFIFVLVVGGIMALANRCQPEPTVTPPPQTSTFTPVPPTKTPTKEVTQEPQKPTDTFTPVPPTATATKKPTNTPVPPTIEPTETTGQVCCCGYIYNDVQHRYEWSCNCNVNACTGARLP